MQDVAEEAVCTECNHIYCQECILDFQQSNGKNSECPMCRSKMNPIIEAQNARELISSSIVHCSEYPQFRCGWQGKYSMWHTHRAKQCPNTSDKEKIYAKKHASVSGLNNITKDELTQMSVLRLKKILKNEITRNIKMKTAIHSENYLTHDQLMMHYDFTKFIEKHEFVDAIFSILHRNDENCHVDHEIKTNTTENKCNNHNDFHELESFPTTKEEMMKQSVKNCKLHLLNVYNINVKDSKYRKIMVEKRDLVDLILKLQHETSNPNYDPNLEKYNKNNLLVRNNSNGSFNADEYFANHQQMNQRLRSGSANPDVRNNRCASCRCCWPFW